MGVSSAARRALRPGALVALSAAFLAGCGSGGGGPTVPTIAPAKTFQLADFQPAGPVAPGKPTILSFKIRLPSGQILKRYKTGPGPHTGIHLLIVRTDLATLIHRHPKIAPDGSAREAITFPAPGVYRVVVDTYPLLPAEPELRNFQLFARVRVTGDYRPQRLPPFGAAETVDGFHVKMLGRPNVRAIVPTFLTVRIQDPDGKPAKFTPYYGALAHAIFFHKGSLDYFHTHICGPNTPACGSITGAPTGSSSAPGVLKAGVLLPEGGVWRLFLQFKSDGKILAAPFTLKVKP